MRVVKSAFLYSVIGAANSLIPLALLPVLSAYLTPSDYGVLSVMTTIISFMTPFALLGIGTAIYIEHFKIDSSELARFISSSLIVPFVSLAFMLLVLGVFGGQLAELLHIPTRWLVIIPFLVAAQVIPYIVALLFQVLQRPLSYGLFQIGLAVSNMIFSLSFILWLNGGWQGRLIGIYASFFLFSLIGFRVLHKMHYLGPSISTAYIRQALAIGIPLLPHELGLIMTDVSDRLVLSKLVGTEATGLYSMGYQVGAGILLIGTSINQAWTPSFFKQLQAPSEDDKRSIVKRTYQLFMLFLVAIMLLYFVTPLVFKVLIADRFQGSAPFVLWIGLGYAFLGMYMLVANYIYITKKTHLLSALTLATGILNVSLTILFVKKYGAIGAAYATTLSYFLYWLGTWWLANRVFPMPWLAVFRRSPA
jgi:O-antigen/teichoic acid export membrane protein